MIDKEQYSQDLEHYGEWIKLSPYGSDSEDDSILNLEDIDEFDTFDLSEEEKTIFNDLEHEDSISMVDNFDLDGTEQAMESQSVMNSDETHIQKIEQDVATLKTQIEELSKQISQLNNQSDPDNLNNADNEPNSDPAGFSDEDSDESIAVTGDELENIFKTEEFSPEEVIQVETPADDMIDDINTDMESIPDEEPEDTEEVLSEDIDTTVQIEPIEVSSIAESTDMEPTGGNDSFADQDESSENDSWTNQHEDLEDDGLEDSDIEIIFDDTLDLNNALGNVNHESNNPQIEIAEDESMEISDLEKPEQLKSDDAVDPPELNHESTEEAENFIVLDDKIKITDDFTVVETEEDSTEEDPEYFSVVDSEAEDTMPTDIEYDAEAFTENLIQPDSDDNALEPFSEDLPDPQDDITVSSQLDLTDRIKHVLKYMDELLEAIPDEKVKEFIQSKHYNDYKVVFKELEIID